MKTAMMLPENGALIAVLYYKYIVFLEIVIFRNHHFYKFIFGIYLFNK